ncbi:MAG: 3-deoxy-manno-octulosonate cytidylyltransferase [Candidatus Lernaella stagnicola]|nr:3-deoxy-manno-octulosonate cytidylyltransferase [Candidatus Lernaella stagnicola]
MTIAAIIPARYASSRLPGKPLADLHGKPMIVRVVERVAKHPRLGHVVVATDDERVRQAVTDAGFNAVITRDDHRSGTDRIAEVAATLDFELIVNVQGDEPMFDPRILDDALAPFDATPGLRFGTVRAHLESEAEVFDPNCVKVVVDENDFALYFSRAPIPFPRDSLAYRDGRFDRVADTPPPHMDKHLGLYIYRRDFLLEYATWPPSRLEMIERLEQLRALERGVRIACPLTAHATVSVDTPADLETVRRAWTKETNT